MSNYERVLKGISDTETYIYKFSKLTETIRQKNQWLNNAKKIIYLHVKYGSTNKKITGAGVRMIREPPELDAIIRNLRINIPRQKELFKKTRDALSEIIFRLNTTTSNYGLKERKVNKLYHKVYDALEELIKQISELITVQEAEQELTNTWTNDKLNTLMTLIQKERQIYKEIQKKQLQQKIIELIAETKKQPKPEYLKYISPEIIIYETLASIIYILLWMVYTGPEPIDMTGLPTFLVYAGILGVLQGLKTGDKITDEELWGRMIPEINSIKNMLNNATSELMHITQEWTELKAINDPDPQWTL